MPGSVCVVIGVGPGNGAAFARRFAAAGHRVALIARRPALITDLANTLPDARAYPCDASDPEALTATLDAIHTEMGPPEIVLFNAGSAAWGTVDDVTLAEFEAAWRINALGALAMTQAVLPGMRENGRGVLLFIGATASRRGKARFAAFASAKGAQRALAESLARHLWPQGIHVALLVIDGRIRRPGVSIPEGQPALDPDDIAEVAYGITRQPKTAWSFEVEARPPRESW